MNGFFAILLKELAHIRRDRTTILFAFAVPALQLTIFGYAIEVTIENVPIAVFDLDGRQETRRLVEAMVATRTFTVRERVQSIQDAHAAIRAGRCKAALVIPADFSERLLRGEQAQVQVLIDGSDSQVATTAMNATQLLVTNLSINRARAFAEQAVRVPARSATGAPTLPIEARTRLLFNPDLESSHFFVPGLIAVIMQLVLLFMTSFSIVKEREHGTLEQLFVTPVGRAALLFGKLLPYALMAFGELFLVLLLMTLVFGVKVQGSLLALFALAFLFIVTVLGLGLLISTIARTQLEAIQVAFVIMLPSVLLSGFMFPRSEMPTIIWLLTHVIPVTYFIEILRGIILRAASPADLAPYVFGLTVCCVVILALSMVRFHKQLD